MCWEGVKGAGVCVCLCVCHQSTSQSYFGAFVQSLDNPSMQLMAHSVTMPLAPYGTPLTPTPPHPHPHPHVHLHLHPRPHHMLLRDEQEHTDTDKGMPLWLNLHLPQLSLISTSADIHLSGQCGTTQKVAKTKLNPLLSALPESTSKPPICSTTKNFQVLKLHMPCNSLTPRVDHPTHLYIPLEALREAIIARGKRRIRYKKHLWTNPRVVPVLGRHYTTPL